MKTLLLLLFLLNLKISAVFSGEILESYRSIRALGMGGALIAITDDENSFFYNPAGMTRTRSLQFSPINFQMSSNTQVVKSFYSTISSLTTLPKLQTLLDENNGRDLHFDSHFFPYLMFRNFGVGFLTSHNLNVKLRKSGDTNQINIQSLTDIGPYASISFRFFSGILKVGATGKTFLRTYLDKNFTREELTASAFRNELLEGIGFGYDAGGILTLPFQLLPSIGVTWKDITKTRFPLSEKWIASNSPGKPSSIPSTINIGASVSPILSPPAVKMNIAADYVDALNALSNSRYRKIHAGAEVIYDNKFYFRLGANSAYWTLGFSFVTAASKFELATYGEEVGSGFYDTQDRRYVIRYALRF